MTILHTPSPHGKTLRVLSLPGRHSSTQFVPLFCRGLEAAGVAVIDIKPAAMLLLRFDIINLHFPAHYIAEATVPYSLIRSILSLGFYCLAKLSGRIIVYTVHDVVPFRPRVEWLLWPYLNLIHRLTDGYMFMSEASRQAFAERFPTQRGKPAIRLEHPAFPVEPVEPAQRAVLRNALPAVLRNALPSQDPAAMIVGFLGSIKPYKGIGTLPSLPRQLTDGTHVQVVVAGLLPANDRATAEPILAQLGDHLTWIDKPLSDADLEQLIQAVDVVLLPYQQGWNSGMAMLVLGAHARVLATRRPPFTELEHDLGAPWIYTFDNAPESRETALRAALDQLRREQPQPADLMRLRRFLDQRSFTRVGEKLREFYRDLQAPDAEPQGIHAND